MDVIPVDLVVSTILAAAIRAERQPGRLHVFHCTSGVVNPTTWASYRDSMTRATREHPCEGAVWYPRVSLRTSRLRNNLDLFVFQMLPAWVAKMFATLNEDGHL